VRQFLLILGEAFLLLLTGGVLFVLVSRLGGPDLLGEYSLVLAWVLLFQGLASFGIPDFVTREAGIRGAASGPYVYHGFLLGFATSAAAMGILLTLTLVLDYAPHITVALRLGTLALIPMMVNGLCRAGFLAGRQMEFVFRITLVESVIVMVVSTWCLLQGGGVVLLVATLCGAKLLSSLLSLYWFNRHGVPLRQDFDWVLCRTLMGPILAFGASNALGMLALRINTIMLSFWVPMSVVGHYAAAAKILDVALIAPSLCAQLVMPRVAYAFAQRQAHELALFEKAFHAIFAAAVPLGVGILFYADVIVALLFGPSFTDAVLPLRILMIYFLIEVAEGLMGMVLKSAHRQNQDVRLYAVNPLLNIVVNLVAIPALGSTGAALAKLAGVIASSTNRYLAISRDLVPLRWFEFATRPLAVSVVAGLILKAFGNVLPDAVSIALFTALTLAGLTWTAQFSLTDLNEILRPPTH
jgi:PST family polysaccharide transporter